MAPLIRTAVNLLLIVSLTMQPMLARALPSSCSVSGFAAVSCHGCGHCEVADPADSCGCCSAKRQESKHAGCCNREQPEPQSPSNESNNESPSSCCEEQGTDLPSPHEVVENSGCTCLEAPDAPYAPVPRPPVNENRDLLPLALESVAIVGSTARPAGSMAHDESASVAADHFAQIEFCVWRL